VGRAERTSRSANRGPPSYPQPDLEPIRVQRRASNTGVIMVAGQKVALARTRPVRSIKANRPRKAAL